MYSLCVYTCKLCINYVYIHVNYVPVMCIYISIMYQLCKNIHFNYVSITYTYISLMYQLCISAFQWYIDYVYTHLKIVSIMQFCIYTSQLCINYVSIDSNLNHKWSASVCVSQRNSVCCARLCVSTVQIEISLTPPFTSPSSIFWQQFKY